MKLEVLTAAQQHYMTSIAFTGTGDDGLVSIIDSLTDRLASEQLRRGSATDKLKQLEAKWRSLSHYRCEDGGCPACSLSDMAADELSALIKGDSNG